MNRNLKVYESTKITVVFVGISLFCFGGNQAQAGFSGDSVIDIAMAYFYTIRAGGSHSGVDRGTNTVKCATSSAHQLEAKCPNDATYTPAVATGGYQAWGVGLAPQYEGEFGLDCKFRWAFTIFSWPFFDYTFVCIFTESQVIDSYMGAAMVRLKWGTDNSTTSQYSMTHPTSVLAFHESTLPTCFIYSGGFDAACVTPDGSEIPSLAGYEAEITFADPLCGANVITGRDHDIDDRLANCFVYYSTTQITELPAPYRDTTEFDAPSLFNIGFGSADAAAIIPGMTYQATQFFTSWGGANMASAVAATHSGAATHHLGFDNPVCVYGFFADEYCFFGVDTASVGAFADLFLQTYPVP